MSWKATAFVKDLSEGLSVTEKFVLLILAEYHRTDQNNSWPSVTTLAADCLMTKRAIEKILARLVKNRFLERESGGGRGKITAYKFSGLDTLNPVPINTVSTNGVLQTPFLGTRNPVPPYAKPRPQKPRNKEERVLTGINGKHIVQIPEWIPKDAWDGFVEMRRSMKRVPFTEKAASLVIANLEKMRASGQDIGAVLNKSTENGWRGVFPIETATKSIGKNPQIVLLREAD